MNRKLHFILLAALTFVRVQDVAHATDIPYPGEFESLNEAIASASASDRIVINAADTYPESFTVDRAVEVINTSGGTVIIDGSASTFTAKITASGGRITGLTLRGGSNMVVEVGPGTVQNCRIEDVSGQLQYDYAVSMPSSGGQLLDNRIVRTTGVKSVNLTASSGSVKRCYFDIDGSSTNDDPAIRVAAGGVTVESDTIDFASGLSHTRWGIEMTSSSGNDYVDSNYIINANKGIYVYHPSSGSTYFRYNIMDGCTHGIWFEAGSGETVERNTVFRSASCSGASGVRLSPNVASSTLSKNLFINVDTGITCGGATNMTYTHNIYSAGACGGRFGQFLRTIQHRDRGKGVHPVRGPRIVRGILHAADRLRGGFRE